MYAASIPGAAAAIFGILRIMFRCLAPAILPAGTVETLVLKEGCTSTMGGIVGDFPHLQEYSDQIWRHVAEIALAGLQQRATAGLYRYSWQLFWREGYTSYDGNF